MNTLQLKPKKDGSLRRYHPWVFSGAIATAIDELMDGETVQVTAANGDVLGVGHFQHGSISVRMLQFGVRPLADDFWQQRIAKAFALRQKLGLVDRSDTTCYRLVHGEGDGLPGLIVDVYGAAIVVQCHSIGMHRSLPVITAALRQTFGERIDTIYQKSNDTLPRHYADGQRAGFQLGELAETTVYENGLPFRVNWETGQKTGFFLDQRANRAMLQRYVAGQRVLNAFCYTGGFSVYALAAGASRVDSVDLSAPAIEMTHANVALGDGAERHTAVRADVLDYLKTVEEPYDVMVVDPPAYAKRPSKRHKAVQGYKRLNALAMRKLRPGGILFTFSCSEVVDRGLFNHTIVAAAIEAGRSARILHELGQGADHPVSLHHPEGGYLKGLVLEVD